MVIPSLNKKYTSFVYHSDMYHRLRDCHHILLLILRGYAHTHIVTQNGELTL